jgi:CheY-like chemotaxis protein
MARILVIDDDRDVRNATTMLLEAAGFNAHAVESGESGVAAAAADRFDAIVVDLFMPDMNGLDTIKALRRDDAAVPIIAASCFMFRSRPPEMPLFNAMATEAGATATLYKPFALPELERTLRAAMGAAA